MEMVEKLEYIHFVLQECQRVLGEDAPVDIESAIIMVEDVREDYIEA
jgi:hypothetical protein